MSRDPRPHRPVRRAATAGRGRVLALALLAALGAGSGECNAPGIRILEPTGRAVLTRMPFTLEVEYSDQAAPGSLQVLVNGTDVTASLVVEPASGGHVRAGADFVWGGAFVLDGDNQVSATVQIDGSARTALRTFTMQGDPYADGVVSYQVGESGGFNESYLPDVVLGPPAGGGLFAGTLDAFSLGLLGEIVLSFDDNVIVDGPGVDFTVFENPFFSENAAFQVIDTLFSEAGTVSVSQDGVQWYVFPCANAMDDNPGYPGCAGVYPVLANGETDARHPSVPTAGPPALSFLGMSTPVPVPEGSGGDSFDLADVGLAWARYVRIQAADHVVGPGAAPLAGFDLDAVAAVNSAAPTDLDGNGVPDAVELP